MTTLGGYAIPLLATAASFAPVVAGRRGWHSRSLGERLLWWWLTLGALTASAMAVLSVNGIRNVGIAQVTFPLFGWLGLGAMGALSGTPVIRQLMQLVALCYLGWWAFWTIDPAWAQSGFAVHSGTMLWILLSVGGVVLLAVRLRDITRQPWRDPLVLVAIAVLVSYLPGAALEISWANIYADDPETARLLSRARGLLSLMGYLLFTAAFILGAKEPGKCGRQ